MFEGDFADMCSYKFLFVLMEGQAGLKSFGIWGASKSALKEGIWALHSGF